MRARARSARAVLAARACCLGLSLWAPACADVLGIETLTNAALPSALRDAGDDAELPDAPLDAGDTKAPVPAPRAVVWFALSTSVGGTCSSTRPVEFPPDARTTIGNRIGPRVVDGTDGYVIDCRIAPAPDRPGAYGLALRFVGADVRALTIMGQITGDGLSTEGNVQVTLETSQFALEQMDCTLAVASLDPGAIWIQSLSCPDLKDPLSPGISCNGTGGVIFENCSF
jgi:hypothetical protein